VYTPLALIEPDPAGSTVQVKGPEPLAVKVAVSDGLSVTEDGLTVSGVLPLGAGSSVTLAVATDEGLPTRTARTVTVEAVVICAGAV
jgi:hypothetical protein